MGCMSRQPKPSAFARLGAVCVAASVIGGAFAAPAAWAGTPDTLQIMARSDAAVSPVTPHESEPDTDSGDSVEDDSGDGAETPAPEEPGDPETPAPAPSPSATPDQPAPTPSDTPAPSQPPAEPAPPSQPSEPPATEVPAQPAPAPHPPRLEAPTELRAPAARLGALLRLVPRESAGVPAPEPTDETEVDGGPNVGGSAELGASVPAQDPTGRTDAVRVGSLDMASGPDLAEPAIWAPWAGALGAAAAAVIVLVLRGGRHLGR